MDFNKNLMKFQLKRAYLNNECFHNHASKKYEIFLSPCLYSILLKNIFEKNLRQTVAMISIFETKVLKSMKIQEIWDFDRFEQEFDEILNQTT